MKKLILLLILGFFLFMNTYSNVYSDTITFPKKLSEVINDKTGTFYENVDALYITQEDSKYMDIVDFSKFNSLRYIFINDCYDLDISKILPNSKVSLSISNSVLKLSELDTSRFNYIGTAYTYDISFSTLENSIINYSTLLNAEYKRFEKNDEELDKVAKEIYEKSSNKLEMIENATLYVINKIDYDYNGDYNNLSIEDSIFEHNAGVCVHYAYLESQLLNKLGIFAVDVGGYVDENNVNNSSHAWVILFLDGEWYSVDPTWIDIYGTTFDSIPKPHDYYMIKTLDTNSTFSKTHFPFFTEFEKIPLKNRVSKMSIFGIPNEDDDPKEDDDKPVADDNQEEDDDKPVADDNQEEDDDKTVVIVEPNEDTENKNIDTRDDFIPFITAISTIILISIVTSIIIFYKSNKRNNNE